MSSLRPGDLLIMAQSCRLIHDGSSSALGIYNGLNFQTGNFSQETICRGPWPLVGLAATHLVMWTISTPVDNFLKAPEMASDA
jgi:hypothetical protein